MEHLGSIAMVTVGSLWKTEADTFGVYTDQWEVLE